MVLPLETLLLHLDHTLLAPRGKGLYDLDNNCLRDVEIGILAEGLKECVRLRRLVLQLDENKITAMGLASLIGAVVRMTQLQDLGTDTIPTPHQEGPWSPVCAKLVCPSQRLRRDGGADDCRSE